MRNSRTSTARNGAKRPGNRGGWTGMPASPTISRPIRACARRARALDQTRFDWRIRMSEDHFHVHGPHEHEVEHQAEHDPFAGRIAVMTAIFATIGALFGYMAGHTQNEALLFKNEAAIRRTEASDQWNFYQAKSSKQNLAELGATLTTGDQRARYLKEVDRYKGEKEAIMPEARKLEEQSKAAELQSEASMHVHHRWAQATTLIQIAIALAAIVSLTLKRGLEVGSYITAGGAMIIGGLALLHI